MERRSGRMPASGQAKAHESLRDFLGLAERSQGQLLHMRKKYAALWVLSTADEKKRTSVQ
jgi:hypothetical protein